MEIEVVAGPARQITPTDVAQFIRLDQCQRYLRLRLYQRNGGAGFMKEYGVVPQSIPPLLTRSGAEFETRVEEAVSRRFSMVDCAAESGHVGNRPNDNARVAQLARDLSPGESLFIFQPRLAASLRAWNIRGDIDILRLERAAEGSLHILIADMKSSTSAKVEHRLQVAFYHEMLAAVLAEAGVTWAEIALGILYRGPAEGAEGDDEDAALREEQAAAAERYIGARVGLLEVIADPESYTAAVSDLVTGPNSTAAGIADAPFEALPFVLNYKCDGCMFNEFCMRWSAEHDDLSLLPYLTSEDKSGLQRNDVRTVREVASLKDLQGTDLVPAEGKSDLVRQLSITWPVGPRLDELILRARRYRHWKGDAVDALSYIPSKGYGSLPYSDAQQNPNLVRVYIDAQHDYLHDRVYMVGARVVASDRGQEVRQRSIVHLTDGPPEDAMGEEALFVRWVDETLRAIVEIAAPDGAGEAKAPIHLIFWNHFDQRILLEGLARHFERILGATPLYDLLTQIAGFDSSVATFMDEEIRELKNYPMVCQSLQAVAAYLRFDWNRDVPYRKIFRTRLFDFWGKFDWEDPREVPWYLSRARFNSQIPLEYAYAAWGDLPVPIPGKHDEFASYREATMGLLAGFQERRLEALEHVAHDFQGNQRTEKTAFSLPDLATFEGKAPTLASALGEFLTLERHVELSDWKTARLAPPERRVLAGTTWIGCYRAADQTPEVASQNGENERRWKLKDAYESAARALNPTERPVLTKEQKAETKWNQAGMSIRLRLDCAGVDCGLDEMLAMAPFRTGDRVVVAPRSIVDSRLPLAERVPITPTPKRLLYAVRADISGLEVERDAQSRPVGAWVTLHIANAGGGTIAGYVFSAMPMPFVEGERYTLDEDPNAWYQYFQRNTVAGIIAGTPSTFYERLDGTPAAVDWPETAEQGQARFLEGLDDLQAAGALDGFEPSKRDYIGARGGVPILLVQGPPGTGKSYSTAFALFARLQGAMAAGRPFRAFLTCKTHAATDVLLRNVVELREELRALWRREGAIMDAYFDRRLLDVPLFRIDPKEEPVPGVTALFKKSARPPGTPELSLYAR